MTIFRSYANDFLISGESDTIFIIELLSYSEYVPSGYFSYWNSHSLFSARQEEVEGYVFDIRNENFFPRWLMRNVQAWNIDSLTALGPPEPLHDWQCAGTYYAYRIIVDKENIIVNSVTFYPSVTRIPEPEEETDELYYRWIGVNLDDDEEDLSDEELKKIFQMLHR